ncbi:hypothetical protein P9112_010487 [Eukaryota sp. TZLM1-RC]
MQREYEGVLHSEMMFGNIKFVALLVIQAVFEPGVAAHISGQLVPFPYRKGYIQTLVDFWKTMLWRAAPVEFTDTLDRNFAKFSKDPRVDVKSRALCDTFCDF